MACFDGDKKYFKFADEKSYFLYLLEKVNGSFPVASTHTRLSFTHPLTHIFTVTLCLDTSLYRNCQRIHSCPDVCPKPNLFPSLHPPPSLHLHLLHFYTSSLLHLIPFCFPSLFKPSEKTLDHECSLFFLHSLLHTSLHDQFIHSIYISVFMSTHII